MSWKGPLKDIKSTFPAMNSSYSSIRVLRALPSLALNVYKDRASTNSLGNLFQCFTTLIVKMMSLNPI